MDGKLEKEYDDILETINSANDNFISNFFDSDKIDFFDKDFDDEEPEVVETIKGESLNDENNIELEESNQENIESIDTFDKDLDEEDKALETEIPFADENVDEWKEIEMPIEEENIEEKQEETTSLEENIDEEYEEESEIKNEQEEDVDDLDIQSFIVSSDVINNEIEKSFDNNTKEEKMEPIEETFIDDDEDFFLHTKGPKEEIKEEQQVEIKEPIEVPNEEIIEEPKEDHQVEIEEPIEDSNEEIFKPQEEIEEIIDENVLIEEKLKDEEVIESSSNIEQEKREEDPFLISLEKELDLDENFESSFKNTDEILNLLENAENSDDFFGKLEETDDK